MTDPGLPDRPLNNGPLHLVDRTTPWALCCGAVCGGLAVALGAFGAHALRGRLTAQELSIFDTASRYQLIHALAIMVVGLAHTVVPAIAWRWSAILMAMGTLFFCGSLYALVGTGLRGWGALTPIGGACLIAGWIAAAFAAVQQARR